MTDRLGTGTGALDGQVVAITGASRGSGLAMARAVAGAGARVALLARSSAHLEEAARTIAGAVAVPVDIGVPDSVRSAFGLIEREFGRLDALVNNAATAFPHRIADVTDDELRIQVDTNLLGPIYCIREALPLLRTAPGGRIVNVSSESAADPWPFLVVYGATKSGLEAMTRGLLQEVRGEGVSVTLLVSGYTKTGGFSATWPPEIREAAVAAWNEGAYPRRVAGFEPQDPEDVAATLLFVLTRPPRTITDVITCRAAR